MSQAVPLSSATVEVRRCRPATSPTQTDAPRLGSALERCSKALRYLDVTSVRDRRALQWIRRLQEILGAQDVPESTVLWTKRAAALSPAERADFADALDRLQAWLKTESRCRM